MKTIPRMRTLPEAIRMLQELDPDTAITLTALRRMVMRSELPVTCIANKRLINFDVLLDYLQNPEPVEEVEYMTANGIRKVEFR